jgi:hypothetical protein
MPPLTDVIGHLLATGPVVRVRTRRGDEVGVAADDVVAVRVLTDAPVRTSQIRGLEHAAALACQPSGNTGWMAGCCAPATVTRITRIPLFHWTFPLPPLRFRGSLTGMPGAA